jgi:hypothetical protein
MCEALTILNNRPHWFARRKITYKIYGMAFAGAAQIACEG